MHTDKDETSFQHISAHPSLVRWISYSYSCAAKAQKMWDNKKFARLPNGLDVAGDGDELLPCAAGGVFFFVGWGRLPHHFF
jgi:hypothetical protein